MSPTSRPCPYESAVSPTTWNNTEGQDGLLWRGYVSTGTAIAGLPVISLLRNGSDIYEGDSAVTGSKLSGHDKVLIGASMVYDAAFAVLGYSAARIPKYNKAPMGTTGPSLWQRHSIEVAVGEGGIRPAGLRLPILSDHVAWRVGDEALHAAGRKPLVFLNNPRLGLRTLVSKPREFFKLQRVSADGASEYFDEIASGVTSGRVFRLPAISPQRAIVAGEPRCLSCWTSTWTAWNRANYHLPNAAVVGGTVYVGWNLLSDDGPYTAKRTGNKEFE